MLSWAVGRRAAIPKKPCGFSNNVLENHWHLHELGSQYLGISIQILLAQLYTSYKTLLLTKLAVTALYMYRDFPGVIFP